MDKEDARRDLSYAIERFERQLGEIHTAMVRCEDAGLDVTKLVPDHLREFVNTCYGRKPGEVGI